MPGPLDVRRAGVLLHLTSLPDGADIGPAAYRFVDFLAAAGCSVWQVLPVGPTHPEDRSPYNAVSAMAGNPDLVSRELLRDDGLLDPDDPADRGEARAAAARRFLSGSDHGGFEEFRRRNSHWLDDYVQFVALRESYGERPWTTWPAPVRDRDPAALDAALEPLRDRLEMLAVTQWFFADQWARLRRCAAERGVLFFGDLPIFVSHDSADVWAHRELFQLDAEGRPTTVTGVPPDYFSADGQRWNNPHYDWDAMAKDDFAWWRSRLAVQRERFDLVRIDHFRGFEAAWHVPADAPTARNGTWVKAPGREVMAALVDAAGPGTLVAEDLGTITPEVEALRRESGLPGMKVLQFAFTGDPANQHLPTSFGSDGVVYTGTHDNDTTVGWWRSLGRKARRQVRKVAKISRRAADDDVAWAMVRLAMTSKANLAVVPAQDLLALGAEARMNTPGSDAGNWGWQAAPGSFDDDLAARLRALVEETGRAVPEPAESA